MSALTGGSNRPAPPAEAAARAGQPTGRIGEATAVAVGAFGVVTALAGAEHGIGEIVQGPVRPAGLVIESWPDVPAMQALDGEPAMTVLPNLLISGVLAVTVSLVVGIWALGFIRRRHAGAVLVGLSLLLLVVGGGFGPPLVGLILGVVSVRSAGDTTRSRGPSTGRAPGWAVRSWRWLLGAAVLSWLALAPGTVLVSHLTGMDVSALAGMLTFTSFGLLAAALVAARAADRVRPPG